MKLTLLVVVTFLFSCNMALAQTQRGNLIIERTKFSLYGAFDLAAQGQKYHGTPTLNGTKPGAMGGFSVEFPIGYGWYLQPEANYTMMGSRFYTETTLNGQTNTYKGNMNLTMKYLNFPLLIKCRNLFDQTAFYFGPQFGTLLGASEKPTSLDDYPRIKITDGRYKKTDLSAVLGIEAYFPQQNDDKMQFLIGLRGQFGLMNVYNDPVNHTKITNNALYLMAGIRF